MGNEGLLAALLGVSRGAVSPTTTLNMAVPAATSALPGSLLGSLSATPATPLGMVAQEEIKRLMGMPETSLPSTPGISNSLQDALGYIIPPAEIARELEMERLRQLVRQRSY